MADFVAVLRKTLDGLGNPTPEMRAKVYDKARATIRAKLAAINPPPPPSVADKQTRALEEAIAAIEMDYVRSAPTIDDPLAELESVFASLKNPQPKPAAAPPRPAAPRPAPPRQDSWSKPAPQAAPPPPKAPVARERPLQMDPPPRPAATGPMPMTAMEGADNDDDGMPPFEPAGMRGEVRRGNGGLIAAAVAVVVIAAGGYGLWVNRDAFGGLFGSGADTASQEAAPPAAAPPPAQEAPATATSEGGGKFTQRLNVDGTEEDPGPATGTTGVGEGTSVAAVTQPPPEGAAPPATDDAVEQLPDAPPVVAEGQTPVPSEQAPSATETATVPVGQKAIFYEERTTVEAGSAESGNIVWSVVQESPGGDAAPEPAIRAEATIPGKNLQLRMTIRRNADRSLPASHIIEMIFISPEGLGGGIENVLRVALKGSEQEAGSPLLGIPAKIADGFFLVALNDTKAEQTANLTLLRRQSWIDIPMIYKSGRRALFTMEKGIPGDRVFAEAIEAWQAADAG